MHLDRIGEEFTMPFSLPCVYSASSHRFWALQFLLTSCLRSISSPIFSTFLLATSSQRLDLNPLLSR